jgi:ABC-type ATPase with predicted acetyltransferase domain
MKKCPTGKRLYVTENLAESALIDANIHFEYAAQRGPIAVYQCQECGHYHLTSQGPMNKRLEQSLSSGEIARQKRAKGWLDKFKDR